MAITTAPRSPQVSRPATRRAATGATARPEASPWATLRAAFAAPLADFYLVLGAATLLVVFGSMMVLSSSSVWGAVRYHDAYYFVKRQSVFLVLGVVLCWWLSRRTPSALRTLGWAGLFLAFGLLLATFVPGLGVEVGGNRNWLALGPLSLQPSEFAKIAMIVWGADVLHRKQKQLDQPQHLAVPFVPVSVLMILLVVLQRDLGTALIMMMTLFGMLWVVGTPKRLLAALAGIGVALVGILVVTSPNRVHRILGFMNPDSDTSGVNHQQQQAMYSLASGGWWGKGLGHSRGKWGSLSQSHTDMVFGILGEELGLLGSLGVVALFGFLAFAGFRIAMRSDSLFARLVSAGITIWFFSQAMVNIAVVLRLLPVLGVPLPFVSYGGSALLANLMALGFLLACARNEPAARRAIARSKGKLPSLSTVVAGRS